MICVSVCIYILGSMYSRANIFFPNPTSQQPRACSVVSDTVLHFLDLSTYVPQPTAYFFFVYAYSKEEHGHCDVAVRKGCNDEHKKLASWAGLQRVRSQYFTWSLQSDSKPSHGLLSILFFSP
jgi:hypothetical protein